MSHKKTHCTSYSTQCPESEFFLSSQAQRYINRLSGFFVRVLKWSIFLYCQVFFKVKQRNLNKNINAKNLNKPGRENIHHQLKLGGGQSSLLDCIMFTSVGCCVQGLNCSWHYSLWPQLKVHQLRDDAPTTASPGGSVQSWGRSSDAIAKLYVT